MCFLSTFSCNVIACLFAETVFKIPIDTRYETSRNIKIVQLFLKKIYASNLLFQNNKGILLDKCNNDKDFIRI